jgi:hypothetical protein
MNAELVQMLLGSVEVLLRKNISATGLREQTLFLGAAGSACWNASHAQVADGGNFLWVCGQRATGNTLNK